MPTFVIPEDDICLWMTLTVWGDICGVLIVDVETWRAWATEEWELIVLGKAITVESVGILPEKFNGKGYYLYKEKEN